MRLATKAFCFVRVGVLMILSTKLGAGGAYCKSYYSEDAMGADWIKASSYDNYEFNCDSGEFLMGAQIRGSIRAGNIEWRCSDGKTSSFFNNGYSGDDVTFSAGITAISAIVQTGWTFSIYYGILRREAYMKSVEIWGYNWVYGKGPDATLKFSEAGPFFTLAM